MHKIQCASHMLKQSLMESCERWPMRHLSFHCTLIVIGQQPYQHVLCQSWETLAVQMLACFNTWMVDQLRKHRCNCNFSWLANRGHSSLWSIQSRCTPCSDGDTLQGEMPSFRWEVTSSPWHTEVIEDSVVLIRKRVGGFLASWLNSWSVSSHLAS